MKDKLLSLVDELLSILTSVLELFNRYKHQLTLGWLEFKNERDPDIAVIEAVITAIIVIYFVSAILVLLIYQGSDVYLP